MRVVVSSVCIIYSKKAPATRASMPPETRFATAAPESVVGTALCEAEDEVAAVEEAAELELSVVAEVLAEVLAEVEAEVLEAVVKVVAALELEPEVELELVLALVLEVDSEVVVGVEELVDSVE